MKIYQSFILIIFYLQACHNLFSQQAFLNSPIKGQYLNDYFIVNYVDWSFDSIHDHHCGSKTYDGHAGTDFAIKNFSQMDKGIEVLAAADGIVTAVVDSLFDRNKTAITGNFGNYIAIRHPNKYYSYYAHLKKNSALVKPGDAVTSGQTLALIGSSGYSSDPHLHFELWYDSLYVVDPFKGSCGNPGSLWNSELPYVDSFGIIDHDFCNFAPSLNELKERIPSQKKYTEKDDTISFWIQSYGIRKDDISTINWYTPSDELWFTFSYTHTSDLWYSYFYTYIFRPTLAIPGIWKAEYLINNQQKLTDYFELSQSTSSNNINYEAAFWIENGHLHFLKPMQQDGDIRIFNTLGQCIYSAKLTSHIKDVQLPLIDLNNTMYILNVSNPGYSKSLKFYKF
ncbi:MAG: peptidoglycan DD-metalloendopeptidase family protein [Saprospiraceae bacterium]|nr:peptidoglycan DD-metalloendopeptidase family protein [Saprospiraceae bacterium]